jgi:hypothetical protein
VSVVSSFGKYSLAIHAAVSPVSKLSEKISAADEFTE